MSLSLLDDISKIVEQIPEIPFSRNYWLIRTQSGLYYETFRNNGFVAIEHEELGQYEVRKTINLYPNNRKLALKALKEYVIRRYPDATQPGIIANQVYKFIFELKEGDIVVIPSESANVISVGQVISTDIPNLTDAELLKTECPYKKRKLVKWEKDILKADIDPFLYRMLQSHQAINNISSYGEIVERSIGNFFIKEGEASVVLEVRKQSDISAKDLFSLGYNLLGFTERFFIEEKLNLNINDVEVKLNLNSPGRIQLKAPDSRTILLIALIVIGINGGGLTFKYKDFEFDLSTDGVIKKVIDYQNHSQDREIVARLSNSMDSLNVLSPNDAVEVLKQFSTNKDKPK